MKHSTLSYNFQLYLSTVDFRAYNIELHTLNCKSDYSGMSAALNIWVHKWTSIMRLQFINRVDNPKFSFNNPVVLCNMAPNYIATFVCVHSNVDPSILQSWMLSSLKSRQNPPKIMGCRSVIWRQRKVSRHSFPRTFVVLFAISWILINQDSWKPIIGS